MPIQFATDPAVVKALSDARASLYRSAKYDRLKVCKPPTGDAFDPYGSEVACLTAQVTNYGTDFRKGLRLMFQHFKFTNNKKTADQVVPLLEGMIAGATKMTNEQARKYVWVDYASEFGSSPAAVAPSRVAMAITAPIGPAAMFPTRITPVPLPGVFPDDSGRKTLPMPPKGQPYTPPDAALFTEEAELEAAAKAAKKPPYILYAGIAAVALVGIGFIATRKK